MIVCCDRRDYRDEACAIANHSLEPALANSAPAHLLQSFWLLSEHRACAATLSVNEISPELEAAMLVSGTFNADCSRRF